ncbi:hypothetical protein [Streptomyces sp. TRM68367]|uniref:hypothetical protein n=1 Tax=Streptomyces sp. TRM68367 TaxID=2758415 RepID=UPI00165B5242|nr:hypothetical protein [Streptomyces sp. TRM68367]MBC9730407.1 hypothetical protein [Streptomyces sp. TRM68367]
MADDLITTRPDNNAALPTTVVGHAADGVVRDGTLTEQGRQEVAQLTEQLAATEGVASVDSATQPFGKPWSAEQAARAGRGRLRRPW